MKYKNILKITILGLALTLFLSSCSDWLRIDPIDQVLDDQIYDSENNTQAALNGIYLKMSDENIYGKELSNSSIELLAQQYAVTSDSETKNKLKYYMNAYNYSDNVTKGKILDIWSKAYSTILDINFFIKKLDATEGIIPQAKKEIMLGEAYGLRAFIHFDMLRLFGPVYKNDSLNLSIPYYTTPTIALQKREPANVIMDKIFSDLDMSLKYLKNDPVIKEGPMAVVEDSLSLSQLEVAPFYRYRNRRLNYYATSALKARALLYREKKQEAADWALSLLNTTTLTEHFQWVKQKDVQDNTRPDRIASSEILFGIHSPKMYAIWDDNFSPGLGIDIFLGPTLVNLKYAFELSGTGQISTSTDYRALSWVPYTDATYMSSYKFSKTTYESNKWYFQPLIRKTELYYIIAEGQNKIDYIDEVRTHRGLKKVSEIKPTVNLATEILLEHMREFSGEGQLFYYYKRKYLTSIRNGSQTGTIRMDASKYVLPIPQVELEQ